MSQTVERAIRILEEIAERPSSIEEIAASMDVHTSTALRTLQVLESSRLVVRDGNHVFRLGSGLFALANQALERVELRSVGRAELTQLSEEIGHTVHLAALERDTVIYVDKRESLDPIRLWSRIGHVAPLHCTALAKAIVAFLPRAQQERMTDQTEFDRRTEFTIASRDDYLTELDLVAKQGYSVDHLENELFVNCIAAPIRQAAGEVVGSVSITTTTLTSTYEELLELVPRLQETCDAISRNYGWRPADEKSAIRHDS